MERGHVECILPRGQIHCAYHGINRAATRLRGAHHDGCPHLGSGADLLVGPGVYDLVYQDHDAPSGEVAHHCVPLLQFVTDGMVFILGFAVQVMFLDANDLVFFLRHQVLEFLFETYPLIEGGDIDLQ